MPLRERIASVDRLRAWTDQIPLHYEYSAGVAGEKFLRALIKGRILSSKCARCGRSYLPPKAYCTNCYLEIRDYVEVGPAGTVSAVTQSHVDFSGRPSKPRTFVFVTFAGVQGGIVHYAAVEGLRIGSRVRARFKAESKRKGTLLDLEGFEKA
ncbi:MAG: OB-fold domain-containing protein [archaeon]|nr:MAG: OB-fold domain-containing protein [archaeon]